METKKCKYCMTDIPKAAKVCPQCGRKQGGKAKWIIIGVIVLILIGGIAGGGGDKDTSDEASSSEEVATSTTEETASEEKETAKKEKKEEPKVEYTDISVETLMNDLEANALVATDTYKGNYYAVTGKLSNIDAQGSYIDLVDPNDEWAFIGVTCYVKSDDVREKIKTLSKDSVITVRGKMKDVGEVFGYYLDIDSID